MLLHLYTLLSCPNRTAHRSSIIIVPNHEQASQYPSTSARPQVQGSRVRGICTIILQVLTTPSRARRCYSTPAQRSVRSSRESDWGTLWAEEACFPIRAELWRTPEYVEVLRTLMWKRTSNFTRVELNETTCMKNTLTGNIPRPHHFLREILRLILYTDHVMIHEILSHRDRPSSDARTVLARGGQLL